MSLKYGNIIVLELGRVPVVVFSSRELAEKVTAKTHDLDFCSRPQRMSFKKLTYNCLDFALSPYGDSWRHIRRLYIVEVLSSKRVKMSRSIREEKVDKMVNQIAELATTNPGQGINLSSMIAALVQDVICAIVLGKSWSISDAVKPTSIISRTLLGACVTHAMAEQVSRKLQQLDPAHYGDLIFLSNLDGATGSWTKHARVRSLMKVTEGAWVKFGLRLIKSLTTFLLVICFV